MWRRAIAGGLSLGLALAATPTVLMLFARVHWTLDDLTAFVAQYAVASTACFAGFLLLRHWFRASAAAAFVAINVVHLVPVGEEAPRGAGEPIRIVSANVNFANRDFDRFLEFAREADPDLLVVLEFDHDWADALEPLRDRLPHAVLVPRDDPFGIALFSKLPFDETDVITADGTGFPSIVARMTHDGEPLTVIGTHPPPPNFASAAANRNRQFGVLARRCRETQNHVILAGDLNVSPWSPYFRDLLRDGDLRDSRGGFDPQATWPAFFPPMMTPIDHVLVSEDLATLDRRVGPDIGSDHRPVVATIASR